MSCPCTTACPFAWHCRVHVPLNVTVRLPVPSLHSAAPSSPLFAFACLACRVCLCRHGLFLAYLYRTVYRCDSAVLPWSTPRASPFSSLCRAIRAPCLARPRTSSHCCVRYPSVLASCCCPCHVRRLAAARRIMVVRPQSQ